MDKLYYGEGGGGGSIFEEKLCYRECCDELNQAHKWETVFAIPENSLCPSSAVLCCSTEKVKAEEDKKSGAWSTIKKKLTGSIRINKTSKCISKGRTSLMGSKLVAS